MGFEFTVAMAKENATELHCVAAVNGTLCGVPTRACMMFRIPKSSIPPGGPAAWKPWFNGSAANGDRAVNGSAVLYRFGADTANEDLHGDVVFKDLKIHGEFVQG